MRETVDFLFNVRDKETSTDLDKHSKFIAYFISSSIHLSSNPSFV